MFTWICPKCGKEVPPSYDECPNCAATAQAAGEDAPKAEPVRPAAAEPPRPSAPASAALQTPPMQPPPRAAAVAAAKSSGLPGWAMSLLFGLAFVAIGAGVITVMRSRSAQDNAQAAAPADSVRLPDPAAVKAHPILKNLEITGLRLTEDAKQKATLQFVIVNHSAADIAGLTATAKIVAVNAKPGDLPMGTFIIKTDLGPYEAKNMKVPVDTRLRAYELPDWQFIRADLDITAP